MGSVRVTIERKNRSMKTEFQCIVLPGRSKVGNTYGLVQHLESKHSSSVGWFKAQDQWCFLSPTPRFSLLINNYLFSMLPSCCFGISLTACFAALARSTKLKEKVKGILQVYINELLHTLMEILKVFAGNVFFSFYREKKRKSRITTFLNFFVCHSLTIHSNLFIFDFPNKLTETDMCNKRCELRIGSVEMK